MAKATIPLAAFTLLLLNFGMCIAIIAGYTMLSNAITILQANPLFIFLMALYCFLTVVLIGSVSLFNAITIKHGLREMYRAFSKQDEKPATDFL